MLTCFLILELTQKCLLELFSSPVSAQRARATSVFSCHVKVRQRISYPQHFRKLLTADAQDFLLSPPAKPSGASGGLIPVLPACDQRRPHKVRGLHSLQMLIPSSGIARLSRWPAVNWRLLLPGLITLQSGSQSPGKQALDSRFFHKRMQVSNSDGGEAGADWVVGWGAWW